MANEWAKLSQYLGSNVASLREKRRMSQLQLADLSGVPRSSITYLESGTANPSLKNLSRIAAALQVSLEELLSPPRGACKLIKSEDVPVLKRAAGQAQLFKLLPDAIPGMEIDRLELKPWAKMAGVPHVQGTKEYLTCVQGSVILHTSGQRFRLSKGDVLAFPGDSHHAYENPAGTKAICLSVVTMAIF